MLFPSRPSCTRAGWGPPSFSNQYETARLAAPLASWHPASSPLCPNPAILGWRSFFSQQEFGVVIRSPGKGMLLPPALCSWKEKPPPAPLPTYTLIGAQSGGAGPAPHLSKPAGIKATPPMCHFHCVFDFDSCPSSPQASLVPGGGGGPGVRAPSPIPSPSMGRGRSGLAGGCGGCTIPS